MINLFSEMFDAVKQRPEAALASIAMISSILLILLGVNQFLALLAPITIYVTYSVRSMWIARSEVDKAKLVVESLEAEGELRLTELADKHLGTIKKLDSLESAQQENEGKNV